MPDRLSWPFRVTVTGLPYQPLGGGAGTSPVVVGAVRSMSMPVTVLVVVLPAWSVQLVVADRLAPSPLTTLSDGSAAGPDTASVQDQLTVTLSVCQPRSNVPVRVGAVLSTLILLTPAVLLFPAASVTVAEALWFSPSPRKSGFGVAATPDSASLVV